MILMLCWKYCGVVERASAEQLVCSQSDIKTHQVSQELCPTTSAKNKC